MPSATAGELLGPGWRAAAPVTAAAAYASRQICFPSRASMQRVTSWSPSRMDRKSLSPSKAGEASPGPMGTFHFCTSDAGQAAGAANPAAFPSRFGPRHCGQSWASAPLTLNTTNHPTLAPIVALAFFMATPIRFPGERDLLLALARTPRSTLPPEKHNAVTLRRLQREVNTWAHRFPQCGGQRAARPKTQPAPPELPGLQTTRCASEAPRMGYSQKNPRRAGCEGLLNRAIRRRREARPPGSPRKGGEPLG